LYAVTGVQTCALPISRAEDEAVMFCGEPDEMEFLHARCLQPVGRASSCGDSNTRIPE